VRTFCKTLFDRVIITISILLFLQMPLFFVHYEAHLEGHVRELARVMGSLEQHSERPFLEQLKKLIGSKDQDVQGLGQVVLDLTTRYEKLSYSLLQLETAGTFSKPFLFLWHLDSDICNEAVRSFSPGFTMTRESLAWGAFGLLFGIAFTQLFAAFLRACAAFWRLPRSPAK